MSRSQPLTVPPGEEPGAGAGRRRPRGWLIFFALAAVLIATRWPVLFRTPLLEQGDLALNALQIHEAKHFRELYGNYSRYEFNHPGPAFFYAYAAGERLFHDWLHVVPAPANAHLLTSVLLQAGFLVLGLVLLARVIERRAFLPLALLTAALFFGRERDAFTSVWAPHVLAVPFFCLLAAGASVAMGNLRHVAWLSVVGGFLFHGHVVQPLFVGAIAVTAVTLGLRTAARSRRMTWRAIVREQRAAWLAASVVSGVFLLPLAIDVVVFGTRSNLAAILGRIGLNAQEHPGLGQSVLFLVTYPVASREQDLILTTLGPRTWEFVRAHALGMTLWTALLALGPVAAVAGRARWQAWERNFFNASSLLVGVAVVCCLVWGMAQAGGMRHYNGYFYHGLFFFALVLAIALAARALDTAWPRPATLAVGIVAAAVAAYAFRSRPIPPAEQGRSIREAVATLLGAEHEPRPKLLVFPENASHVAAAVGLELTRRNQEFFVPAWWSFMFQARRDARRLGPAPESAATVWWIAPAAPDGVPLNREFAVFREPAPLEPAGGRIDFSAGGNGLRYVVSGLFEDAEGRVRTNERRLVLRFSPRTAGREVRIAFEAAADSAVAGEMPADVFFDGQLLGRVVVSQRGPVAVVVPAAQWNSAPVATLELRFASAVAQRARHRPAYEWWAAWQLWRVEFGAP